MKTQIELDRLKDSPYQKAIRFEIDWTHVGNLVASMKDVGLRDPVIVRHIGSGMYEIADGHHRVEAAKRLDWETIEGIVRELSNAEMLRLLGDTTLLKKSASAIEQGRYFLELTRLPASMTQQQIADAYGRSQSDVANKIRLTKLPDEIQHLIADGTLSERHGRAMLWLADNLPAVLDKYIQADGEGLWKSMAGEVISVALTEHFVDRAVKENTLPIFTGWDEWRSQDNTLTPEQITKYGDRLRPGPCAGCECRVTWAKVARCTDTDCHVARQDIKLYEEEKEEWAKRRQLIEQLVEDRRQPKPPRASLVTSAATDTASATPTEAPKKRAVPDEWDEHQKIDFQVLDEVRQQIFDLFSERGLDMLLEPELIRLIAWRLFGPARLDEFGEDDTEQLARGILSAAIGCIGLRTLNRLYGALRPAETVEPEPAETGEAPEDANAWLAQIAAAKQATK